MFMTGEYISELHRQIAGLIVSPSLLPSVKASISLEGEVCDVKAMRASDTCESAEANAFPIARVEPVDKQPWNMRPHQKPSTYG